VTLRVLHLAGSAVSEFLGDLSRLYARDCLEHAADPARYEFHVAYVTPDRQWRFPASLSREAIRAAPPMPLADAVRQLTALGPVELGREVRCGVIVRDGQLVCLPLEEYNVDPATRPIRDYADKISRDDDGELSLVAKDSTRAWIVDPGDPLTQRVHAAARQCHVALGCRDYSLFDFRIDPAGQPWFLEAGLYCSFAEESVISTMARAAGISLPELFRTAIGQAAGR
jgi:hypothetical protein